MFSDFGTVEMKRKNFLRFLIFLRNCANLPKNIMLQVFVNLNWRKICLVMKQKN